MSKSDKALSNSELELTQRIQMFWPRGEVPPETLKEWNGAKTELITERIREAFGRGVEEKVEQSEPEFVPASAGPLLIPVATITIPALPEFDAAVALGPKSKVKIYDLGGNFKTHFLNKKEKAIGEAKFQISELTRNSVNAPIVKALGGKGKIELSLAQFAWLLEQQPNGEGYDPSQGRYLLADGYANIAYIFDDEEILRAVLASWYARDAWAISYSPLIVGYRAVSQFQDPKDLSSQEIQVS